jgi:hemerythrin superfamily protein
VRSRTKAGFFYIAERRRAVASQTRFGCARRGELTMTTDDTTTGKPADAIDILSQDHRSVKELFKEFARLEGVAPTSARIALVQDICTQLSIHTALEEELFYPAVRKAVNENNLVNVAEIEHETSRFIIQQLLPARDDDAYLQAKVTVLREYTQHHINEEENEIFPRVKKTQLDLAALGQKLMERRMALQNQLTGPEQLMVFVSVSV